MTIAAGDKFDLYNDSLSMHNFFAGEKVHTRWHCVPNVPKSRLHRLDKNFDYRKRKPPAFGVGVRDYV